MLPPKYQFIEGRCIACGYDILLPFYDEVMPLATISWPETAEEAQNMEKMPLNFVVCVKCSHVFNESFSYGNVPYSNKPNLMFNASKNWNGIIKNIGYKLSSILPANPCVLEIGYGDGSFLNLMANCAEGGKFVGFDPNGAPDKHSDAKIEFRQGLFDPAQHMTELKPDLVILRHIIEHLENPIGFLRKLAFAVDALEIETTVYVEVPCIDRVGQTGRTTDFYYEHVSNFTTASFRQLLIGCGADIVELAHEYDGEVVYAIVRMAPDANTRDMATMVRRYRAQVDAAQSRINKQIDELLASEHQIVVWGGTGKAAAFLNHYAADESRIATVVDSDANKIGTYVPGTGQLIRSPEELESIDELVVILPAQWRAMDIIHEMRSRGITPRSVLIEHDGRLVDFLDEAHPYKIY